MFLVPLSLLKVPSLAIFIHFENNSFIFTQTLYIFFCLFLIHSLFFDYICCHFFLPKHIISSLSLSKNHYLLFFSHPHPFSSQGAMKHYFLYSPLAYLHTFVFFLFLFLSFFKTILEILALVCYLNEIKTFNIGLNI